MKFSKHDLYVASLFEKLKNKQITKEEVNALLGKKYEKTVSLWCRELNRAS